ncbi:hypothetical protein QBC46DRAFT_169797 [Diplogelasinospora grovesii]|uniref:Uncharacterized protein n=1 Tax=Diplogelasinospora grovesii TaxID=303347 RepID=A0AAN6S2Z4_9PEZI|nr:hypothetical protein QBC46DRAFT_169797 [Diplogelasinospora grovesii]
MQAVKPFSGDILYVLGLIRGKNLFILSIRVINDHFDREHGEELKEHLDHFRIHVQEVHHVTLRPSDRVKSFPKSFYG